MEAGARESYRTLVDAVLAPPGDADPATRRAAFDRAVELAGDPALPNRRPGSMDALVDKVARHAYKVTDRDVAALRDAGHSEDAIFEVVVAAAVGAGTARLDAGLRAVHEARTRKGTR
jgi:alkylhydroperoxidase family enzyme